MARKICVLRLRDEEGRFKKDGPYVEQHSPTHSHIISTNNDSRFRFADLTGELRNCVFEHAVRHPRRAAEQQPGRVHDEGCGPKCDCDIMSQVEHHGCANATAAGGDDEIFHVHQILPDPGSLYFLRADDCCTAVTTRDSNPGILEVSRQLRTEALGLFYLGNTFVVDDAQQFVFKNWLFEVVGWANMKNVRRLFCEFDNALPSDQVLIDYTVVILLMELGLLKCQLRVTFTLFRSDHIGCKLRKKVRELIAAQPITKADVEGNDVGVVEALVAGTAREWRILWMDDDDSLGLGDANEEARFYCTVCDLDEDDNRLVAPLFESL